MSTDDARPETPPKRLGRTVKARREALGLTQAAVAAAIDRDFGTIAQIEQGRRKTGIAGTTRGRLEKVLRWVPGSIQAILDGGEPVELPAPIDVGVTGVQLDPTVRGLIDEVMLTSPEDLPRLVAMLKALTRSWRDQQG